MKKALLTLITAAIALTAFAGVAQAQTAPEDLPAEFTAVQSLTHDITIVQDGFVNNSTPINKFVVTIKNHDRITVNYKNPAGKLGLTVYAHNDATNGPDFHGNTISRKGKNMKRDRDVWVDLSSLPGNIFYVMLGDSVPTKVSGGVPVENTPAPAPATVECPTAPAAWTPTYDADGFPLIDGLSEEQAVEVIEDHGWSYRYASINGAFQLMDMSLGHGRYNLTVDGGCLISYSIEKLTIVLPALPEFPQPEFPEVPEFNPPLNILPPEATPCNSPFLEPVSGEGMMFQHNDCQWGIVEFIQEDCGEAFIRVEFESPVPEKAQVFFNGEAIVDGVLNAGVHTFDVTAFITEDNNMVDAFIGDQGQTFFMVGNVEICEEVPVEEAPEVPEEEAPVEEAPEAPVEEAPEVPEEEVPVEETPEAPKEETPEAPKEEAPVEEAPEAPVEEAPVVEAPVDEAPEAPSNTDEAPEAPSNTDGVEEVDGSLTDGTDEIAPHGQLPDTGANSFHMVLIALGLLVAGSLLLVSSKIKAAEKVVA